MATRTHGTLIKWNDERGFGFISVTGGKEEVFVHISAFPRDGRRPQLNELISFEVETNSEGKRRAMRIMRPGQRAAPVPHRDAARGAGPRGSGIRISAWLVAAVFVIGLGVYGYQGYRSAGEQAQPAEPVPMASMPQRFSCDGRTMCSQMNSCEEAKYFIRNCPNTAMDGDNDGVPCETQWCQ